MAVLIVGYSRKQFLKKRLAVGGSRGRKKWRLTDDTCASFFLEDNSVFLLHPDDEKPRLTMNDKYTSQYVHRGVNREC